MMDVLCLPSIMTEMIMTVMDPGPRILLSTQVHLGLLWVAIVMNGTHSLIPALLKNATEKIITAMV